MKKATPRPGSKTKPKLKRARISLDVDTATKDGFEKVRTDHNVSSLTELVKKGISCFDKCMNQNKKGQVIFRNEDGTEQRILFL